MNFPSNLNCDGKIVHKMGRKSLRYMSVSINHYQLLRYVGVGLSRATFRASPTSRWHCRDGKCGWVTDWWANQTITTQLLCNDKHNSMRLDWGWPLARNRTFIEIKSWSPFRFHRNYSTTLIPIPHEHKLRKIFSKEFRTDFTVILSYCLLILYFESIKRLSSAV